MGISTSCELAAEEIAAAHRAAEFFPGFYPGASVEIECRQARLSADTIEEARLRTAWLSLLANEMLLERAGEGRSATLEALLR